MNHKVILHQGDFPQELLAECGDSEGLCDLIAKACGQRSQNELFDNCLENLDGAIDYVMEHFDFEEAWLQHLNETVSVAPGALLHGAFMKLERPIQFEAGAKEFEEKQRAIVSDCLGDYLGREGLHPKLAKELEEAYCGQEEQDIREWLNGDYRNFDGISKEVMGRKGLNFPDSQCILDYEDYFTTAVFDFEEADALQLIEDYDGEEDRKEVPEALLKEALVERLTTLASNTVHDEKVKRDARREEHKRTQEYKKKREQEKEEAEVARLRAMIKK
jgi:hypothetical protein